MKSAECRATTRIERTPMDADEKLERIRRITVEAMARHNLSEWGDHAEYHLAREIGKVLDGQ
jgi:hypothetical protein